VRNSRPKNLDLFTISFPLPAIVSLMHRISGACLFILIPVMLWGLSLSLTVSGFDMLQQWAGNVLVKIFFWLLFIPFLYHLVAGIRHLLSDIHVGDTLKSGRLTAKLVIAVSVILVIAAGIWLW
jgi:succinate dehydrogenase / fumarate reductase, cytochrome b subunit